MNSNLFLEKITLSVIFFCFLLAFCFLPCAAFAGWQKQKSGTLAWLRSIYFLDAERGFAVGSSGTLIATADGGANWEKRNVFLQDNFRDIAFVDEQIGWIIAERDLLKLKPGEARSYLLLTRDGGETWRTTDLPENQTNSVLTRFVFSADKEKLWAVGEVGTLYALNADGVSWQKKSSPTKFLLNGGAFLNRNQGWLVGAGGTLVSTTDGGAIWRDAVVSQFSKPRLHAAYFPTAKTGWLIGADGKIFATSNGGRDWREQLSETRADLLDVYFTDANQGWIVGDANTLLHTANGGTNWKQEKIAGSPRRLEKLFFADKTHGWAVGFGGAVWAYTNSKGI